MGGKTQTVTQKTQLPAYADAAYQNLFSKAASAANLPYQAYTGQQIASFNPTFNTAAGLANNVGASGQNYLNQAGNYANQSTADVTGSVSPYLNSATALANQGGQSVSGGLSNYLNQASTQVGNSTASVLSGVPQFSGDEVAKYQSPYTQQVINATLAQLNQSDASAQSDLLGRSIMAGSSPFGSDRAGLAAAALAGQQSQGRATTVAGLNDQAYQQALGEFNNQQALQLQGNTADRSNAANAASLYGNLGSLSLSGAQADSTNALNAASVLGGLGQTSLQAQQLNNSNAANAASTLGSIGQATTANQQAQLQAMLTSAGIDQDYRQSVSDAAYQQFQQQQQFPYDQVNFLSGALSGAGNVGGTTTQTSPQQGGGILGKILGGVGAIASLFKDGGAVPGYAGGGGILSGIGGILGNIDDRLQADPWRGKMLNAGLSLMQGNGQQQDNQTQWLTPVHVKAGGAVRPGMGIQGYAGGGSGYDLNPPSNIPVWQGGFTAPGATTDIDENGNPVETTTIPVNQPPQQQTKSQPGPMDLQPIGGIAPAAGGASAAPPAGIAAAAAGNGTQPVSDGTHPFLDRMHSALGGLQGKFQNDPWRLPLLIGGLAAMASNNPRPLGEIGEGGLAAVNAIMSRNAANKDRQAQLDAQTQVITGANGHYTILHPGTGEMVDLGFGAPPAPPSYDYHTVGDALVRTDSAGNATPVYSDPTGGGTNQYTLGPGQARFDANNQQVAAVPAGAANIDYPDPDSGYVFARNEDGTLKLDETGAPIELPMTVQQQALAAQAAQQAGAQAATAHTNDLMLNSIGAAISGAGAWTTGFLGSLAAGVRGTPAYDLARTVDTIKANIAFDRLQQIRSNSPTGGALGSISDREEQMLAGAEGNLETAQSQPQFVQNLRQLQSSYLDVVHGPGNWRLDSDGKIWVGQSIGAQTDPSATHPRAQDANGTTLEYNGTAWVPVQQMQ